MKIARIETYAVGAGWKNLLFVEVYTDTGLIGLGEGTLNGFIRTTEAAIRELQQFVIGQDPTQVQRIATRMMESVSLDAGHIHRTAVAAIEVACWDILGQHLGVPIWQLLGGRVRLLQPRRGGGGCLDSERSRSCESFRSWYRLHDPRR